MDWSTPIFLIFVGMISAILWLRNDIDTLPDATLKSSYDYIVGMYVTLHRILKPSYDYTVGMYVTLHRILKPSYDYIVGMYIKTVLWLHSMLIVLKINVMSCLIYR
jgi:hypothetical protein